jgi:hypothetical protein
MPINEGVSAPDHYVFCGLAECSCVAVMGKVYLFRLESEL